ncbi:MAG: outer membrane beta-barrel protein [Rhodoferax sp.]|nr:outer membrane beta-barrel protein [Rhodoferax sp.]
MKLNTIWSFIGMLSLAGGLAAPAARAADASSGTGLYLGGSVSFSHASDLGAKIDSSLASQGYNSSSSADSWNTNGSLRLGYQLSPNFALEGTYDRVGNMGVQSSLSSPTADTALGNWKSYGLGLHALGIVPIDSQWSVYGRLGVEQWHTSLNLTSSVGGPTSLSNSDDTTSLALGAGVSYALTRNVDATAELIHYTRVGDPASTGRTGLNQFSLGLRYHFQ